MCDPVSFMAVATAASLAIQQEQADAQSAANEAQSENARRAQLQNANQVNLERQQYTDSASQKLNANNMNQRDAVATTVAQAGPSGLSVDALIGDMARKGGTYNESVESNLRSTNMALDNQLTNVNNSAATTVAQLKAPQMPDYLGAALKIGGAYVGGTSASGATPQSSFGSGSRQSLGLG